MASARSSENRGGDADPVREEAKVEYVGIDWATRRAAWCALDGAGEIVGEGALPLILTVSCDWLPRRGGR